VTHANLKQLAYSRHTSTGQLVREAIAACYQTEVDSLPLPQRQALAAYQGGFISIGKLATVMGLHVLEARRWLDDHHIPQLTTFGDKDTANA
jgi:hypothetical protein